MGNRAVVAALVGGAAWLSASSAFADPTCRCRYDGQYYAAGEATCIVVNGEARQARCGMIQNNTAWKFTGSGCPVTDAGFLPVQTAQEFQPRNYTPVHH